MALEPVLSVDIPGVPLFRRGKVRDVFDLGEYLLVVATDRISAFDAVMPNGIPRKGEVLTALSRFWFELTGEIVPNHLVTTDLEAVFRLTGGKVEASPELEKRSMLVRRTDPYPLECVVRGYLAGSGWKEYREKGSVCGTALPAGLRESDRLPGPLFTPSTKEEEGHDRNLTAGEAAELVGEETYHRLSRLSIELYRAAAAHAEKRGIIIADTKFEFGRLGDQTILIDEALTPDSSRFWPLEGYEPGRSQRSFDKQFVRDYLESTGWDKNPPAPALPADIVAKTMERYLEAHRLLTAPAGG